MVLLVVAAACSGGGDRSISGPATITPERGMDIATTATTCYAFDYARADVIINSFNDCSRGDNSLRTHDDDHDAYTAPEKNVQLLL